MTFNQWAASPRADGRSFLIAAEAVWKELAAAGKKESEIERLFNDLVDGMRRRFE